MVGFMQNIDWQSIEGPGLLVRMWLKVLVMRSRLGREKVQTGVLMD